MYYPKGLNPIHPVRNWLYIRQIARAAIRGENIPPMLVDGENLLAGTHRAAANDLLERMGYGRLIEAEDLEEIENENLKNAILAALEEDDYHEINSIWDG
jgi:hypothetical protein